MLALQSHDAVPSRGCGLLRTFWCANHRSVEDERLIMRGVLTALFLLFASCCCRQIAASSEVDACVVSRMRRVAGARWSRAAASFSPPSPCQRTKQSACGAFSERCARWCAAAGAVRTQCKERLKRARASDFERQCAIVCENVRSAIVPQARTSGDRLIFVCEPARSKFVPIAYIYV